MASPQTCADDSCGAEDGGFPGTISDFVDTAGDFLFGLNISMEHVVNYGGPSGKVWWASLACLGVFPCTHMAVHCFTAFCTDIFVLPSRPAHSQIIANGASLLASLASLIIMVGFKVTPVFILRYFFKRLFVQEGTMRNVEKSQWQIKHGIYAGDDADVMGCVYLYVKFMRFINMLL